MNRELRTMTAVVATAVILIGLIGGCCTKRDVDAINTRLGMVESQTRESRDMMTRTDSLLTATTESNKQLQNDVRQSSDAVAQQLSQLLENYNDLITRIERLSQQPVRVSPSSSPGAQAQPAGQPPAGTGASKDCLDTYDAAFTQVRRGEYEAAITGFRKFLAECSTHADVQNAYYWIGECFYLQEKYTEAIAEYEQLLKNYPDAPNIRGAIYKLGRCKQELGKTAEAKAQFQRLVKDYAGTLEADQAAERLKDLK
jgi:tol-pal system protein YbgF